MTKVCSHLGSIKKVTPSARGCEECLKTGSPWVHLRICRSCGHVGVAINRLVRASLLQMVKSSQPLRVAFRGLHIPAQTPSMSASGPHRAIEETIGVLAGSADLNQKAYEFGARARLPVACAS
jgi:hypothetical protein